MIDETNKMPFDIGDGNVWIRHTVEMLSWTPFQWTKCHNMDMMLMGFVNLRKKLTSCCTMAMRVEETDEGSTGVLRADLQSADKVAITDRWRGLSGESCYRHLSFYCER